MSEYLPITDHPKQVEISTYWSEEGSDMSLLREGLPYYHKQNLWNWFTRTYPNLNPAHYGIKHPLEQEFAGKTREQLIDEICTLRCLLEAI